MSERLPYIKPDGSYDWDKYEEFRENERQNRIDTGQDCYRCGKYIVYLLSKPSGRRLCPDCVSMRDRGKVDHPLYIRCPKCRHESEAFEMADDILGDGEHEISCRSCDHEFTITTSVSFIFSSPALDEKADKTGTNGAEQL